MKTYFFLISILFFNCNAKKLKIYCVPQYIKTFKPIDSLKLKESIEIKLYHLTKKDTSYIKFRKLKFSSNDSIDIFLEKIKNLESNFIYSKSHLGDYRFFINCNKIKFTMTHTSYICYYKGKFLNLNLIIPWSLKKILNELYKSK
jgi:hypothetical protein